MNSPGKNDQGPKSNSLSALLCIALLCSVLSSAGLLLADDEKPAKGEQPIAEMTLSELKDAYKTEAARLDETYSIEKPPPENGSEFERAKELLFEIAKRGDRESVSFILKCLEEEFKNAELELHAFQIQREALAQVPEKSAGWAMMRSKVKRSSTKWEERVDLIYGFRYLKTDKRDDLLRFLAKTKDPRIASAAIRALGARLCADAMPTLLKIYDKHEKKQDRLWLDARQSMTAITGYDFGSAREWKKKWSELQKMKFDPKNKKHRGKDKFYFPRRVIHSQRVCMLLDTSSSMKVRDVSLGPEPSDGSGNKTTTDARPARQRVAGDKYNSHLPLERQRLFRGKKYIQSMLTTLKKSSRFNICHFNQRAFAWQTEGQLASVDDGMIETALDYLDGYKPQGLSNAYAGFQMVYTHKKIDTIVYMSDGFASGKKGERVPYADLLAKIRVLNRHWGHRIFTVGFRAANKKFMKELALTNGGSYHEID